MQCFCPWFCYLINCEPSLCFLWFLIVVIIDALIWLFAVKFFFLLNLGRINHDLCCNVISILWLLLWYLVIFWNNWFDRNLKFSLQLSRSFWQLFFYNSSWCNTIILLEVIFELIIVKSLKEFMSRVSLFATMYQTCWSKLTFAQRWSWMIKLTSDGSEIFVWCWLWKLFHTKSGHHTFITF